MLGSGGLVEIVQGAVQQRARSLVDGLAGVTGIGRVDQAGIDQVGFENIQGEPEALLDGFGQCVDGVGLQVG